MGRTVPSPTFRIDQKLEKWRRLSRMLGKEERDAFESLIAHSRRLRTVLFECEDEVAVLLLLGMVIGLKAELERLENNGRTTFRGKNSKLGSFPTSP
jgi:hypothetical protein